MTTKIETFKFSDLKSQLTKNFKKLAQGPLFYVSIDRDEIWDHYLSGFSEEARQEHNCNSCKSFLRQYAGIVAIIDNKTVSIWDNLEVSEEYQESIDNLKYYIHSRPITDIALFDHKKCGTDKNIAHLTGVEWGHFFFELPSALVVNNVALGTRLGTAREDKNVLKRSLDELTLDATETVLELNAQGSLYRGKEFEFMLNKFLELQKMYALIPNKDNFCWTSSPSSGAVSRIRNTSIGTLLVDLSSGMDLDQAVTRFEKVVAPTNYKRPTSLVTPKMVEQAKATLTELGLLESLERRFAQETDLSVADILFTYRPSPITDVFDEVAKESLVNPKSFAKVEEMGIQDFLENVVPTAKSIEILLENKQLNNLVTILTSKDKESPSLFKWDSNFSWSYTGAIADSIKERVKKAGGNVIGELRTSLSWFNYDDLDIHVLEPNGTRIIFNNKVSRTSGGKLDVDMNAGGGRSRTPVENIIWTDKNRMTGGTYKVMVNNFCQRETKDSGFAIQIECAGEVFDFEFKTNPKNNTTQDIAEFSYSKTEGIKFKGETKSNVVSKEKWGIKTNQFHKVTKVLLSPNHWGDRTGGNKHFMFMLEGCIADEAPRPFFNEFLKEELSEHRKVLEILGAKVKIEEDANQLSGLGFSETMRASMIVRVTGKFTRTLRINF